MIHTLDQLIKHNAKFYNEFVDLKVEGWGRYSKAYNIYTFGFFSNQVKQADEFVEKFGSFMKMDSQISYK